MNEVRQAINQRNRLMGFTSSWQVGADSQGIADTSASVETPACSSGRHLVGLRSELLEEESWRLTVDKGDAIGLCLKKMARKIA